MGTTLTAFAGAKKRGGGVDAGRGTERIAGVGGGMTVNLGLGSGIDDERAWARVLADAVGGY